MEKRAARKFAETVIRFGVKGIRRNFQSFVRTYTPAGTHTAYDNNDDKNRYGDIGLLDKTRVKVTIAPDGSF